MFKVGDVVIMKDIEEIKKCDSLRNVRVENGALVYRRVGFGTNCHATLKRFQDKEFVVTRTKSDGELIEVDGVMKVSHIFELADSELFDIGDIYSLM